MHFSDLDPVLLLLKCRMQFCIENLKAQSFDKGIKYEGILKENRLRNGQ